MTEEIAGSKRRDLTRLLLASALLIAATIGGATGSTRVGFSSSVTPGLIRKYTSQFGPDVAARIAGWRKALQKTSAPGRPQSQERELLQHVNQTINAAVKYTDDKVHWGVEDYWASPAESVASSRGDCEDYAIAKYFALKEAGVPVSRLQITYVRTSKLNEPHMVLAWYPSPDEEPYILDNLDGTVRRASDRPDLVPVYGFNDEDLFMPSTGETQRTGSSSQVRLWRHLLEKLEAELRM